jgi:hypothetical protein
MSSDRPDGPPEREEATGSEPPTSDRSPTASDPAASEPGSEAAEPEDEESLTDEESGDDPSELDDVDVRDLLRKALSPPADAKVPNISERVQHRIRERSEGRYFATRWSTSSAPGATFLVTSLLMLLVVVLAWLFLSPTGFEILTK